MGDEDAAPHLFRDLDALRKPGMTTSGRVEEPVWLPPRSKKVAHRYFRDDTMVAKFASHPRFEHVTLTMIVFNAFWIGYDTNSNFADSLREAEIQFKVGENIFCFFFTFELTVRFLSFKNYRYYSQDSWFLKDKWFDFDSVLVFFMIVETWVMLFINFGAPPNLSLLRMLRLARLTRMTRLMRAFPQMLTLVKGIVAAIRSVFFTLLLLSILMYIFAIIFTSTYKSAPDPENPEEGCDDDMEMDIKDLFGTMGNSMMTLFLSGTLLDDLSTVIGELQKNDWFFLMVFIIFIVLASFLVLNMMIGILFEVVAATAEGEQYAMKIGLVREVCEAQFKMIDEDGSGIISQKEFLKMCDDDEVMNMVESELEIEKQQLKDMAPLLFSDDTGVEQGLTFEQFMTLLIRMRPGERAGPIDVQEFRKLMRMQEKTLTHKVLHWQRQCTDLTRLVARAVDEAVAGGSAAVLGPAAEEIRQASKDLVSLEARELLMGASDAELFAELCLRVPGGPAGFASLGVPANVPS